MAPSEANTSPEEGILTEIRVGIRQIEFKKGSARLVGASKRRLQAIATLLMDHNWVQVDIVGHTDSTGKARDNLALSRKRADYVKWFLVDQGVDTARIHAWGEADRKPIDKRPRKAKNRRVEFAIE